MSFQDAIEKILHVVKDQNGNPMYVPYITRSGKIPPVNDPVRSDYNDTTLPERDYKIHGGVDIIYGEMVNGVLTYKGPGDPINQNVSVYSPVTGNAWNVKNTGTVIILDEYGYYHIIRHLRDINPSLSTNSEAPTPITGGNIKDFWLGIMSNKDLSQKPGQPPPPIHVHYEITTYYTPTVQKHQKIDPEAFWNNPPDTNNGFFTLTGTYKKGNEFFGTSNREILRGEGDGSLDDVIDNGLNLNTNGLDNDSLYGGGGSDIIDGGTGDDTLYGGNSYGKNQYYEIKDGKLNVYATSDTDKSADTLIGGMGSDYLDGGKGDDFLYGGVATISNGKVTYDEESDPDESRDTLKGGEGNDKLYGGKGADYMEGGPGNDTYEVDNPNDTIVEKDGEGTDLVESTATYTLPNYVENLTLMGEEDINGTGNKLPNEIKGNKGNNIIDGGLGVDTMIGGAGDDTYIVDNPYDVVLDFGGGFCFWYQDTDTDTVQSSISYTLGYNVENLTLTGQAAINGTGNALDNVLMGNSGNNKLTGGAGNDTLDGGAGNDTLIGGSGDDLYAFMRGYGQDTISDYDTAAGNSDTVQFGSGIDPIDLILVKNGNSLDIQINDSPDLLRVQNQNSCKANQVEVFEAGDGSRLVSSQVDLLIQAMAGFSADNAGMSWTQLIDQKPTEVLQILAQYWQPPK